MMTKTAQQEELERRQRLEEQRKQDFPLPLLPEYTTDLRINEDDTVAQVSKDEEESESSGAHANDALNQPDAKGRVLINLNHPATEEDIFLSPQLSRAVKPHQIGGIRFLYDNLVESLELFSNSSGFGCILAHSMGLGKTLQVISFIDILFRHTAAHSVLAIVPCVDSTPQDIQLMRYRSHVLHSLLEGFVQR
ncbi:hypothetical protein XENOCAPTIV_003996 [Xenoophorus captivus]|uniref:SNF2 N-terminal domain-containing protein n=1 Tax=Xenoophorus captivus TaxID=1517983 RepID=A0ABV0RNM5_9TELE